MYNNKIRQKVNLKNMLLKKTEKDGVTTALYESSNILASKWNGKDLTIIFKRGASYTYNDVSRTDYTRFEMADSQGAVLNAKIKTYSFTQNDNVNEIALINEINEAKDNERKQFEEGLINYMELMVTAYKANPVITSKALESLSEMIIKHNTLAGSSSKLKLCKCD